MERADGRKPFARLSLSFSKQNFAPPYGRLGPAASIRRAGSVALVVWSNNLAVRQQEEANWQILVRSKNAAKFISHKASGPAASSQRAPESSSHARAAARARHLLRGPPLGRVNWIT